MTDDEKPLWKIAWERFIKHLGTPPVSSAPSLSLDSEPAQNERIAKSALLTAAAVTVGIYGSGPLKRGIHAIWGGVRVYLQDWWWVAVAILLVVMSLRYASLRRFLSEVRRAATRRLLFRSLQAALLVCVAINPSWTHVLDPWFIAPTLALFAVTFYLDRAAEVPSQSCQDDLRTDYVVDRLIEEVIGKRNGKLRRIALNGSWGSGKTTLLKRLQHKLNEDPQGRFRVAWVNPWMSTTPDQAKAQFISAFEQILGHPISLWRNLLKWPGLSWLSGIKTVFGFGVTFDITRAIAGDAIAAEAVQINRINARLQALDATVVILVDDMERTGPDIVRKLFPVIDRLGAFQHCYFVFAIDPDRVARAFSEEQRNEEETKGYLDKVFDLQLEMPDASKEDLARMLEKRLDREVTPKLFHAWSKLKAHLPTNPRAAIHFFNHAVADETLFLSKYGRTEHDYQSFFLLRMLDLGVPGISTALVGQEASAFYEAFKYRAIHSATRGEETSQNLINETWKALSDRVYTFKNAGNKRIIVDPLVRLILESDLDRPWAASHYRRPLTPSAQERSRIRSFWGDHGGNCSLRDVIQKGCPGYSFANEEDAARELIESEILEYSKLRQELQWATLPGYIESLREQSVAILQRLEQQFKYSLGNNEPFDHACIDSEWFAKWFEILCKTDLTDAKCDVSEIKELELKIHRHLSDVIGPVQRFQFVNGKLKVTNELILANNRRTPLDGHIAGLRSHMMEKLRDDFIRRMKNDVIDVDAFKSEFEIHYIFEAFGSPLYWLSAHEADWPSKIEEIEQDHSRNPWFEFSILRIVDASLKAVNAAIANYHDLYYADFLQLLNTYSSYHARMWAIANRATSTDAGVHELRRAVRDIVEKKKPDFLGVFDAAFSDNAEVSPFDLPDV